MTLSKVGELIVEFEEGNLNGEEIINLFQLIYDTKAYTWLQGCYGRTLAPDTSDNEEFSDALVDVIDLIRESSIGELELKEDDDYDDEEEEE